jgi:hypothetical protein
MLNSGSQEYAVAQARAILPILSIAVCSAGGSAQLKAQTTLDISTRCMVAPSTSRQAGVAVAGQNPSP